MLDAIIIRPYNIEMPSLTSNYLVLSKVIFVFHLFGFLKVKKLCFIFGENPLTITHARVELISCTQGSQNL
jgi:hypothetical protein